VTISVTCVTNGATSYDAVLGYANEGATSVDVPVGDDNGFSPPPAGRGQPTSFPARTVGTFTVTDVPNGPLVWTLKSGGMTATAAASDSFATKCGEPSGPAFPVEPIVQCVQNHGSTYDATFGYSNPNSASVTVPVGEQNNVSPGNQNQGQPSTFDPGPHNSVFTIPGIQEGQTVTWSLTTAPHQAMTAEAMASFATKCSQPAKIGIFVRCVTNNGSTFDATFGYQSDNLTPVTVPVGEANKFSPTPQDRGQTTVFQPGNTQEAFTVKGIPTGQDLVWTLTSNGTRTSTASASNETKCSDPPPAAKPIGVFVTCIDNHGSTYDATFGYQNDNNVAETIEIGPANGFSPEPVDRGQPEVFVPGRTTQAGPRS
jgi:uncharacterized protein (DUF2249 family)